MKLTTTPDELKELQKEIKKQRSTRRIRQQAGL